MEKSNVMHDIFKNKEILIPVLAILLLTGVQFLFNMWQQQKQQQLLQKAGVSSQVLTANPQFAVAGMSAFEMILNLVAIISIIGGAFALYNYLLRSEISKKLFLK